MAVAAGGCGRDAGRPVELGGLLRSGASSSSQSQSDPHTDGSLVVIVEARHPGTVDTVRAALAERLAAAGYTLTCPGGRDPTAPAGQQGTRDPRITCGLGGHRTDGTVWLSTAPGEVVSLSAVVGGTG